MSLKEQTLESLLADTGSVESPVVRYLAVRARKAKLLQEVEKCNAALRKLKKDSEVMTLVGAIDRAQFKRDNPEEFDKAERRRNEKKKAAEVKKAVEGDKKKEAVLPIVVGDAAVPVDSTALVVHVAGKKRRIADKPKTDTDIAFAEPEPKK